MLCTHQTMMKRYRLKIEFPVNFENFDRCIKDVVVKFILTDTFNCELKLVSDEIKTFTVFSVLRVLNVPTNVIRGLVPEDISRSRPLVHTYIGLTCS